MAAPLFDVRDALVGHAGERSAQDVLGALKSWVGDGTVVFGHVERLGGVPLLRGAALLLLQGGEVRGRRMLGRFAGLASSGLEFQAVQHGPSEVATVPSVDAGSTWTLARATPRLVDGVRWPARGADLPGLHQRLEAHAWSGLLSVGSGAAELWRDGRVVAARAGTATGAEAMRALRRASADEATTIALAPLDGRTAAALHGLAEGQRHEGTPALGLVCERDRTLFVVRGEADLAVAGGAGVGGAFASADRLATTPLRLPDEPAGWESHRYTLTLRGRDALNPMTDRWSAFDRAYGDAGRRLLEAVGGGDALDVVARASDTDFDALRQAVERWESDGVVRRA